MAISGKMEKASSTFADILNAVDTLFNKAPLKTKSRLTKRNVRGIQQVTVINAYLENKWGVEFRIKTLDKLVEERIETSISENGKSREELIKFAEALNKSIQDEQTLNLIQRGLGK